ncbi:hypothetical protein PHAVU_008G032551 [Phaseolus vulgaris]
MASNNIKIHQQCRVAPPSAPQTSLPLVFFDMFWLRFHPVERIFFYTLPITHSNPSIFFTQVVPKLKTSLSHTLQHFSPLAGNVVWPNSSSKPVVQYTSKLGLLCAKPMMITLSHHHQPHLCLQSWSLSLTEQSSKQ